MSIFNIDHILTVNQARQASRNRSHSNASSEAFFPLRSDTPISWSDFNMLGNKTRQARTFLLPSVQPSARTRSMSADRINQMCELDGSEGFVDGLIPIEAELSSNSLAIAPSDSLIIAPQPIRRPLTSTPKDWNTD
jgi:hypothetical protein